MSTYDYSKIALKIGKMGLFADIHQLGAPSAGIPVDLYCETLDGIRFYVSYSKYDGRGWCIDYSFDPTVNMRKDFNTQFGFRNQTETLKFVEEKIVKQSKYCSKKEQSCEEQ